MRKTLPLALLGTALILVLGLFLLNGSQAQAVKDSEGIGGAAPEGYLDCFPWYTVGTCSQCPGPCVVTQVRACQVCSSGGCSFYNYETRCYPLPCAQSSD